MGSRVVVAGSRMVIDSRVDVVEGILVEVSADSLDGLGVGSRVVVLVTPVGSRVVGSGAVVSVAAATLSGNQSRSPSVLIDLRMHYQVRTLL